MMRKNSKLFIPNVITLLSVLLLVLLFSACNNVDKAGPATATVSIKMSRSQSSARMVGLSSSLTDNISTELIALVPDNTSFSQCYSSLANLYQYALTDLSTDKVELTVPLGTSIRLYAYLFEGAYTISELQNTAMMATKFGQSSTFSISSGDTSKEVSLKITSSTIIYDITDNLSNSAYTKVGGSSPSNEDVYNAFDGSTFTKYLNFGEEGSGVIIDAGASYTVDTLGLTTANDTYERDPASISLYGSHDNSSWISIVDNSTMSPPVSRYTNYDDVYFCNSTAYQYYKLIFETVRDSANANSVQISEIRLGVGGKTKD